MFGGNKNSCPEECKMCACCQHAQVMGDSGACICDISGLVHSDSLCRKFVFDLLKYKPRVAKMPSGEGLDFNLD